MRTRIIIGIAGASGSGKTTLARKLMAHYGADKCAIISEDDYYKDLAPGVVKVLENFDEPASLDFPLLIANLKQLLQGQATATPVFDYNAHKRKAEQIVAPKPIVIVEGILAFSQPELLKLFSLKIFVKRDLDYCLMDRLARDTEKYGVKPEENLQQYRHTVGPMRRKYIAPSKARADLIVKNSALNKDFDISKVISFIESPLSRFNLFQKKIEVKDCQGNTSPKPAHSAFYV